MLKSRNLQITDESFAKNILSRVNYYRLSAYGLGLHEDNVYRDGVSFEDIYRLYEFDVRFRYVLLEEIEKIEIMFRTQIAHYFAINYGSESYLDEKLFLNSDYHNTFIKELDKEKNRQKNSAFVKHHNTVYSGKMPIWVIVELFSFGMLSHFYSNMKREDQIQIAKRFCTTPVYIRSWLKALVEIRNLCANYGRIYNRILTSTPKLYREHKGIKEERVFAFILVIKKLLNEDNSRKNFIVKLQALLEEYNDIVNLSYIGFPVEWKKILGEYIVST